VIRVCINVIERDNVSIENIFVMVNLIVMMVKMNGIALQDHDSGDWNSNAITPLNISVLPKNTWKIARCIDHVFLPVKLVIIISIVLELGMSVMSSRAEIIECWVIVFCAIIEQNASITCHSATGSMIVWIEQMNRFASGTEVFVQSDNFLVQI